MEGDYTTYTKYEYGERISIHSLRMEGDLVRPFAGLDIAHISIHSLRMEGDWLLVGHHKGTGNFNPLPPHGGRRCTQMENINYQVFQSTPSAWRET